MAQAATKSFRKVRHHLCAVACIWLAMTGCQNNDNNEQGGTLTVVTRNGPTTYYEGANGATGFEFELVKRFAESQNLKLNIIAEHSLEDLFKRLKNGDADLAAAGLTITEQRQKQWLFSTPYLEVKQYLLYHSRSERPRTADDIINARIHLMANSSHSEIFVQLAQQLPELSWHESTDTETTDLLERLKQGKIDYTVVDSNEYLINRSFYPRLKVGFELGQPGQLAWALPKDSSPELQRALLQFFNDSEKDGSLARLEERFYSHIEQITPIGTRTFVRAVERKYPRYQQLIERIARENDMEWQLLAAISYQESHWNPRARSPTGVRGMMMLTLPTAREMNVSNRLDAEQSLRGGAAYFQKILARIPQSTKEPDRTWMALASYNFGFSHLLDARRLTQLQGGSKDKWADVKTRLPLLQRRQYYRQTRHGYARGVEALNYVQNIRHFYNYLSWAERAESRVVPPQQMEQYLPDSLRKDFNAL